LKSHTWKTETVHTGVTAEDEDGSLKWTKDLTALRDGDPVWTLPFIHPGVVNPALGPGKPNLVFVVMEGDLFVAGRSPEDIEHAVATVAQSRHIGLLCTKYTKQMARYLSKQSALTVERRKPKLWLGFSAEDQEWFDKRWPHIRPFAEVGWLTYVSLSPLLGPVILPPDALELLRWVIVNGECEQIKPELCRPMEDDWARAIYDQCRAAGIPFFMRKMHSGAHIQPDLTILRQFPSV
jgi:protein gp37